MVVKNNLLIILFALFGVLIILRCSTPIDPPLNFQVYSVQVTTFYAQYDPIKDNVILTWDKPTSQEVTYYEIHSYTGIDADSNYIGERIIKVNGDSLSAIDPLQPVKSNYNYFIIPCFVQVKENTPNIYRGVSSPVITVRCGLGVSFSVNRGASFVADTACSLFVNDDSLKLTSVCFSQDTLSGKPSFTGTVNPMGVSTNNSFSWVLKKGTGLKTIYAQMKYKSLSKIDTLKYDISIAPYHIQIKMANETYTVTDSIGNERTGKATSTALQYSKSENYGLKLTWNHILHVPKIQFSLNINLDSTIDTSFQYWIIFANQKSAVVPIATPITATQWLETAPRTGHLTNGGGSKHDDTYIYEYDLDPSTAQGRENLNYLKLIKGNQTKYPLSDPTEIINQNNPDLNFIRLKSLPKTEQTSAGLKEFIIVAKFKGKYFGEDRYVFSKSSLFEQGGTLTATRQRVDVCYFDFYQPFMTMLPLTDESYFSNGDTLSTIFDIKLAEGVSVEEKGKDRVSKLQLIIAQAPENKVAQFNYAQWGDDSIAPVTLSDMLSMPHTIYDYPILTPQAQIKSVKWERINPLNNPSGKYFIGIVASDEWGNSGFASVNFSTVTKQTNPWMVTILTGK